MEERYHDGRLLRWIFNEYSNPRFTVHENRSTELKTRGRVSTTDFIPTTVAPDAKVITHVRIGSGGGLGEAEGGELSGTGTVQLQRCEKGPQVILRFSDCSNTYGELYGQYFHASLETKKIFRTWCTLVSSNLQTPLENCKVNFSWNRN